MIFEYAYKSHTPRRLRSRLEWDVFEERAYGRDPIRYKIRPFQYAVNRFLVSKTYFVQAMRIWLESVDGNSLLFNQMLLRQFVKRLGPMPPHTFKNFMREIIRMDRLETLDLEVQAYDRKLFGNAKCPFTEIFSREDICALPFVGEVLSLQVLRHIRLVPSRYFLSSLQLPKDRALLLANIEHMETSIQSLLDERSRQSQHRFLRPADTGNHPDSRKQRRRNLRRGWRKHKCTSLYNQSAVCAFCSDGKKSLHSWAPSRAKRTVPHRFEDLPNSLEGMRELISDQRESAAGWLWRFKQEGKLHEHPSGQLTQ